MLRYLVFLMQYMGGHTRKMNMTSIFNILCLTLLLGQLLAAQAVLTPEDAVTLALKHNYDIQISKRRVTISEQNKHILNSGYLPSLTGSAGASLDVQNTEGQLANGETRIANGAETRRYNAAVNLNYTLFDGLGRLYNYKRLKETYQLSALEARQTIETTLLQLFTIYYSVAQFQENISVLEAVIRVSEQRLKRAEYQFEYGQTTKLEVLNAAVDLRNDSINLITATQQLRTAKRDLNVVLGQDSNQAIAVNAVVHFFKQLDKDALVKQVKVNNVRLLQAQQQLKIRKFDIKTQKAQFLPTLGLTGSYGWNEVSNNSPLAFLLQNTNSGWSGGLNLRWNLFDGGTTATRTKNAATHLEIQALQNKQLLNDVYRNFNNAWDVYQNQLYILELQNTTVTTAQSNFDRTKEQYKLGQVNSIAFRQAQINLTNAELRRNQAKYQAKISELDVLRIAGDLLNIDI